LKLKLQRFLNHWYCEALVT